MPNQTTANTHRIYSMEEVIEIYLGKTPNGQLIHDAELEELSDSDVLELAVLAADALFLPEKQRAFGRPDVATFDAA